MRRCRCRGARGCRAGPASGAPPPRCRRRRRSSLAGFGWWSDERRAGVAGYNHSLNRRLVVCCSCSKISSNIARIGCSPRRSNRDRRIGLAEPPAPPIPLFIRSRSGITNSPPSKIPNPLTAADARDGTTRLWQLRGCYIEIAGLSAAFGRPCSTGAGEKVPCFGLLAACVVLDSPYIVASRSHCSDGKRLERCAAEMSRKATA
jgi:hypothetical protein